MTCVLLCHCVHARARAPTLSPLYILRACSRCKFRSAETPHELREKPQISFQNYCTNKVHIPTRPIHMVLPVLPVYIILCNHIHITLCRDFESPQRRCERAANGRRKLPRASRKFNIPWGMKGTRRLRARIPVSIGFSCESLQREYPTPLMSLTILTNGSSPRTIHQMLHQSS